MDRSDVIVPMIEYYIGCPVDAVEKIESVVFFSIPGGSGKIRQNTKGNWEVYVNMEKITEIEDIVFKTVMDSKECLDLESYYDELRTILSENLTPRSSALVRDIMASLEYLLINEEVKIKNPINIGKYFIFMMNRKKAIICLN